MLFETFHPRVLDTEFQHHQFGMILFVVDVVVLIWVLGEDVKLTGVHVTQIGIEARGVETHPQSEAKLSGAHRVAHYGDIREWRQVRVISDGIARARVLAEGICLVFGITLMVPKEMCTVRTLCAQVGLKGREMAAGKGGEAGQRRHSREHVD